MPACLPPARVGPACGCGSLGYSTSAGFWRSLGLMGMDHRQLSCAILGFSHILRGRGFPASALSLKLSPHWYLILPYESFSPAG